MEPFAQVGDVQRRLDFTLSEQEATAVSAALEDLSNEARFIADREWSDVDNLPNPVRNTVVKAATRWARNMNGYVLSRAGDETLQWANVGEEAGAPEFTAKEIKLIRAVGDGRQGAPFFGSIEVYAYVRPGTFDHGYLGTVNGGNKPFPFNQPGGGW
ncbi:hypothetical protein [Micromonospora sp. NBC_01813]|uniref:hypothetical protein n=1 Tax=Micromonospora sp. NBC_01813 TaxID=2975988 RepID=UPI002DD8F728|nr:hypothetical protein [Micromonospora sp. NBC_01813]WSA11549.1 hypothetical protein OG958_12640 [Micromonospora sp. NBC_01813]